MNALRKTLVIAVVMVGAAQVWAGDQLVYGNRTHNTCNCGCKGDQHEHGRRVLLRGRVDEFEPNSKRELALQIFTDRAQLHTINPDGDEDWIMFVPRQSGRYVMELTNVTIDLEGELWAQYGKDNEKRVEKFKVDRGRNAAIHLDVAPGVGYFKIRVEADDNDDVGAYRLSVRQVSTSGQRELNVLRPDIFESDNKREAAVGIRDNSTQLHTIYPRDDEDWMIFEPTQTGDYLLKISNATTNLKGELWVRRGDDKERRVEKFDVSRWGQTMGLRVDSSVRYYKILIEADDNDDTGDYRIEVVRRTPVVIRPTLRTPPIYERTETTIYTRPSRPVSIIPQILGAVLRNTRLNINIGSGSRRSYKSPSVRHGRPRTSSHYRSGSIGRSSHYRPPSRTTKTTPYRSGSTHRSTSRTQIHYGSRRR